MEVGENGPEESMIGAHSRYVSTPLLAVNFLEFG